MVCSIHPKLRMNTIYPSHFASPLERNGYGMEVFQIVFPILLIPLVGFLTVKNGLLTQADGDSIARFTFSFLIPTLLFINMAQMKIPQDMNWNFLSAYYLAVFIVYFLSIGLSALLFAFSASEQSVFALGASYSNTTVVGIPVCVYALGKDALLPLFILISIHNLVLFSLGIMAAERKSLSINSLLRRILDLFLQLLKNPITGSLIVGIAFNFLHISLYHPLQNSLNLFSQGAVPAALFVLGMSMNKYQIKGNLRPAIIMVCLKALFLPLVVWFLAFHFFALPPLWAATALLTAAMPVGINAYIFSQKYQACVAVVGTGIVISTIMSVMTLTLILTYIHTVIS